MKPRFNIDIGVALILFALIFGCKLGTIALPFYWDEMCTYALPAHELFADGHLLYSLPGLHPPFMFLGHPPAIYVTLTLLYRVFGEHIVVSHAFVILVAFAGVYYTYLLGKHLHGRAAGVIAALLLFFSPLFFSQAGMVTGDLVITSLGVVTVYYFLRGPYWAFLVSSIVLVLSKESAVALVASIAVYSCFDGVDWKARLERLLRHSPAIVLLAVFFIVQKRITGMYLPNPYFTEHHFLEASGVPLTTRAQWVLEWTFTRQYRWLLVAAIAAYFLVKRRRALKKEQLLFLGISLSFIVPFTFIFFIARYILSVFPYFCVMGAVAIVELFAWRRTYVAVAALTLVAFVSILHPRGPTDNGETDMQYSDILVTHRDACRYVGEAFPDACVLTNSPFATDLMEPALGYVSRRIDVTADPDDPYDIIVYSEKSTNPDKLSGVVARDRLIAYKSFSHQGELTKIYGPLERAEERDKTDMLEKLAPGFNTRATPVDGGLRVDGNVDGDAPNLRLPIILGGKAKLLRMVLDAPSNSELTVRYRTVEEDEYSESRKLSVGRNEIALTIADEKATGDVVLGLAKAADSYLIRAAQISDFSVKLPPRTGVLGRQWKNNLDDVNGHEFDPVIPAVIVASAEPVWTFRGWAVDEAAGRPASSVTLLIDHKLELPAEYGRRRKDVVRLFKIPEYLYSGFIARVDSDAVSKGRHRISMLIRSADGLRSYRSGEWWLEVR